MRIDYSVLLGGNSLCGTWQVQGGILGLQACPTEPAINSSNYQAVNFVPVQKWLQRTRKPLPEEPGRYGDFASVVCGRSFELQEPEAHWISKQSCSASFKASLG